MDWSNERVFVTGGAGFLGSYVVEKLRSRGCRTIITPRSSEYDLAQMDAVERLYRDAVAGIGATRRTPESSPTTT